MTDEDTSKTDALESPLVPSPRAGVGEGRAGGDLPRGSVLGRYTVLELVGRGAVGEVYAAYDPKLDRRVALKLLRGENTSPGRAAEARLLREAQAIAKVSHPNVVTVHDVGTFGERIFLAMEYVDGVTLKDWLSAAPRPRADVLAVFGAAARGLAAAHAAGLVHRDFKPGNVMVGNDGAVRVMDFGLVRWLRGGDELDPAPAPGAATDGTHAPNDSDEALPSAAHVDLTRTGEMLGTPRYMSPEQFHGRDTDARSDQFAFCVSLYEGLYGALPFEGDTIGLLFSSVTRGELSPPPARAGVPGYLRRVVTRGLEVDPARRFPSMPALLDALERNPVARRRRAVLGAGLVAALALAVVAVRRPPVPAAACGNALDRWAGVWQPGPTPRREAIHAAFAATGRPYGESAFTGAAQRLDAYVEAWGAMYRDACESHARGEQSAEILDLRMRCLRERLTSARATTDVLARADGEIVDNAIQAVTVLPSLGRCADVKLLRAAVPPPENDDVRVRVDELRGELARFVALRESGHCAEASGAAPGMLERVRATGYLPLLADALTQTAKLVSQCGDVATAMVRFEDAYATSVTAKYDEGAAMAAIQLAWHYVDKFTDLDRGRTWTKIARATLARFERHPLLETYLHGADAVLLEAERRHGEAVAEWRVYERGLTDTLGPESVETIGAIMCLGNALRSAGLMSESLAEIQRSADLAERVLGPKHPVVASASSNGAETLNLMGRHEEARAAAEHAVSIFRAASVDSDLLGYAVMALGTSLLGLGRPIEAVVPLSEAFDIRRAKQRDWVHLGEARVALARALWATPAERRRARGLVEAARADYEANGDEARAKAANAWLAAPTSKL